MRIAQASIIALATRRVLHNARRFAVLLVASAVTLLLNNSAMAQELEPRAYASAPVGLHVFVAAYSRARGSVIFDPTLPIEDVTADIHGIAVGYYQSMGLFGRFANIGLTVPYVWGSMQGLYESDFTRITRSGLGDPRLRLAVNLVGAPALKPKEFAGYRQKTNLGLSFTLSAPLGQYDPVKLINIGTNRWAFKPEVGVSHRNGRWLLEAAGGIWFIGANSRFLGALTREQSTVLSFQGHVIYDLPKRMWIGTDLNFFYGGKTKVDGEAGAASNLRNSRFGATFSFPIHRRHSFKIFYDNGLVTRLGSDFWKVGIAYQLVWLGL